MTTVDKYELCTACQVCRLKCPKQCIKFQQDKEGFDVPEVDFSLCVKCGKCVQVCPQLNKISKRKPMYTYAVQHKDQNTLLHSSSGGAMSALAESIFEQHGVVVGTQMNLEKHSIRYVIVDNLEGLEKLRGSKYIESSINDIYVQVENYLKRGTKVLFVGTPCHIAGLKVYLEKEYDNLITIDLICHGVPNAKIFFTYLNEMQQRKRSTVKKYEFRNKERFGWKCTLLIEFVRYKKYVVARCDSFFSAYYKGVIHRNSCYACHYACGERCGDITIGDYWGIEKYHGNIENTDKGVSLVLVNTEKGAAAFADCRGRVNVWESQYEWAATGNGALNHPSTRPEARNGVYEDIEKFGFEKGMKKHTRKVGMFYNTLLLCVPRRFIPLLGKLKNRMKG